MFYHNHIYDDRPSKEDLEREVTHDGLKNYIFKDVLLTLKSKQTGNTYEQIGTAAVDASNDNIIMMVYVKRFWLGYSIIRVKKWIDIRNAVSDDYIRAQRQTDAYKKLDESFISDLKKI
jgi:hypothetical protein